MSEEEAEVIIKAEVDTKTTEEVDTRVVGTKATEGVVIKVTEVDTRETEIMDLEDLHLAEIIGTTIKIEIGMTIEVAVMIDHTTTTITIIETVVTGTITKKEDIDHINN